MGRIKTYNSKLVIMTFGTHIVSGYADDSFVNIENNGDGITKKVGCDGEIARSVTPDDTLVVKFTLLQTSATNSFLQNMANYDRATGEGMLPLLIKDLRGGMIASADAAWVVKPAARQFGKETNNREWEIHTGSAVMTE